MNHYASIIDANINRISEGLRVIEEYTRFIALNKSLTAELSDLRKKINASEDNKAHNLASREPEKDMRAKERPQKRVDIYNLLKANFKRAEEGCRVLEEYSGKALYNEIRYDLYLLEKEILLRLLRKELKSGEGRVLRAAGIQHTKLDTEPDLIVFDFSTTSARDSEKLLSQCYARYNRFNCPRILKGQLALFLLYDFDGICIDEHDISAVNLRRIVGPHKLIGGPFSNKNPLVSCDYDFFMIPEDQAVSAEDFPVSKPAVPIVTYCKKIYKERGKDQAVILIK